jgi:hypothetical protein
MNRFASVLTLLLLTSAGVYGQKVKYKELFVLLDSKQYKDAEPFLRKYLKENDDNPNAYLFMGFIHQDICMKGDVLKESELVAAHSDSAIHFFALANKGITEKELKRNDEYYQIYSRRDQRTGEFGIKISDIHLDLEKRTEEMKHRKDKVKKVRAEFVSWERLYQSSSAAFKALQEKKPSEKELLLQSDEKTLAELTSLQTTFDSCRMMFDAYKATMTSIGKTGYNQVFNPKKIEKFKHDGQGLPDFYSNEPKAWDFGSWAAGELDEIENEVEPFREKLVAYDVEINKLFDKVRKDSASVTKDIRPVEDKLRVNPVARFDSSPMPLVLFSMKLEELRFNSGHIDNKKLRDSSSLAVRLDAIKGELKTLVKLDSIAAVLVAKDIEQETANYQHFVTNAYGSTQVLKSLITSTKEFSEHEKHKREDIIKSLTNSLNWLIVDQDSIGLGSMRPKKPHLFPLAIAGEKFVSGLKYGADSVATGFFYTITPNRIPDLKASFTVDKVSFAKRNLPVVKELANGNDAGTIFYALVYSETKVGDKFPVTIARITKPEGITWTTNHKFAHLPSEVIVSSDTGQLTVKITLPDGESKLILFDIKTGKELQ